MSTRDRIRRTRLVAGTGLVVALGVVLPLATANASPSAPDLAKLVNPIDPQNWENPDHMKWSDYVPVPETDFANPASEPAKRKFKVALVLGDFTDQPFLITQPKKSHPFGNPRSVSNVPDRKVAKWYERFLNKPTKKNHGHTMNEYWMEDTYGEFGVDLDAFGAYHLPGKLHEYGLGDFQGGSGCPTGDFCQKDIRDDLGDAWVDDVGQEVADEYELVFYLTAGHDESGTWQEFGEMKFESRDDVPDEFGPPDDDLPNWVTTRYIDWTSWLAGAGHWPNAGGGSSTQAESSGMSTYAHELSHLLGIGDNYNNPYGVPPVRSYSGIWDMMSRGTFNGPGGPHKRWVVPANRGSTMGAQHMLRNKMRLGVLTDDQWVSLTREGLPDSGLVMAEVTARAVASEESGGNGLNIAMQTGDKSPVCNPAEDPLCDRGGYNNYTVEVVDRMGTDSFTPDSGVLMAKTKNADAAPFVWVIDANPQDIDVVDFVAPDGEERMITIGDYRQLADALFHAGTRSGSEYEYVDEANRLHFYVLDMKRDADGVLRYVVAVRSLDGAGPHTRGVTIKDKVAAEDFAEGQAVRCRIPVTNTGKAKDVRGTQPENVNALVDADVYRVSAKASDGWKVWLPREVVGIDNGDTTNVEVYAARSGGGQSTTITMTVRSESDKTVRATGTCER
jgi:M6 family metalloprotease-like protein